MSSLERYFQPNLAFIIVLALAATQYATLVFYMLGGAPDFVVGGDFVAFWAAARETLNGDLVGLYAPDGLYLAFQEHRPEAVVDGLTWQYPPHASLLFSPIGYLPFELAYAAWCALGLGFFTWVLTKSDVRGRALIAILATVPVLIVLNTGQNALFTAGLLMLAVFNVKQKPVLAGVAAAVLTLKPQLGILIPVFFIAGGHWRAFIAAGVGSLLIWGGSVFALGKETWFAFFEFIGVVSGSVTDGNMPLYKMLNVYAAARLAAIPESIATILAGLSYLAATAIVVWVCRKTSNPKWRYGILASATLLTAPYSMYYELVLLVPAIWFVVEQGHQAKWLKWERESVAALLLLTLVLPGPATQIGASFCFLASAFAAVTIFRRVRVEFELPNSTSNPAMAGGNETI